MKLLSAPQKRYLSAVATLSGFCLSLLLIRLIVTGSTRYFFIPWNLALAWLGLILGWLLVEQLKNRRWLSWQNLALTVLWLTFLPNTWYVLTDFLHVYDTGEISQLYDIVTMAMLVFSGFALGFASLYIVHKELRQRLSHKATTWLIGIVIFLSSFAIYLGRDLRWNTWDIVTNPVGIIIDVTDRVLDPLGHPRAVNVTSLFFVLISVMYVIIWRWLDLGKSIKTPK